MARKMRECYLCGETYKYCPTCSNDRTKPSWMAEFHSESCKDIFDICTRFNLGMISKIDAQEELKSCDLTNKESFKSCVKRDLEIIFVEEPKKKIKKAEPKPVAIEVVEPAAVETESHEVVLEEK